MFTRMAGALLVILACAFVAFGALNALSISLLVVLAVGWLWARNRDRRGFEQSPPAGPDPHDVLAAVPQQAPSLPVADMATDELCVAWRRSYFHLLLAIDETARRKVVQRRQDYLDEIERRDRRGFLRWLDSGARAGSDPSSYLTMGS